MMKQPDKKAIRPESTSNARQSEKGVQPNIRVCGVPELGDELQRQPASIISIWDPHADDATNHLKIFELGLPGTRVFVSKFDDIPAAEPGKRLVTAADIRAILRFAETAPGPMLVHCRAGISRSTAITYAILCQASGPGSEAECMRQTASIRPQAVPNLRIVTLADEILGRDGEMVRAHRDFMRKYIIGGGTEGELNNP
ncbi:MAG: tyrosine phosphatase family protein [Terrimicrobiaceae bacterium]